MFFIYSRVTLFIPPFLSFFLAPSSIPKVCKRLLHRSFQSTSRRVLSPIEIFDSTRKKGGKGSSIEFRGESIDPKGNDQKAISPRWRARDTLDAKTITSKGWEDHPRVFGFESTSAANIVSGGSNRRNQLREMQVSHGEKIESTGEAIPPWVRCINLRETPPST